MAPNPRVGMTHEEATELLLEWSGQKRTVGLVIAFEKKFMFHFTKGRLEPSEADTRVFLYLAEGVDTMVSPYHFERCEREETEDLECVIFSDTDGTADVMVTCSKENKPILVEQLSRWLN